MYNAKEYGAGHTDPSTPTSISTSIFNEHVGAAKSRATFDPGAEPKPWLLVLYNQPYVGLITKFGDLPARGHVGVCKLSAPTWNWPRRLYKLFKSLQRQKESVLMLPSSQNPEWIYC